MYRPVATFSMAFPLLVNGKVNKLWAFILLTFARLVRDVEIVVQHTCALKSGPQPKLTLKMLVDCCLTSCLMARMIFVPWIELFQLVVFFVKISEPFDFNRPRFQNGLS